MIKVTIVEDVKAIREGLVTLINNSPEFDCSSSYERCEDMLSELNTKVPDVILMDINLPGISGIEGIKKVKKLFPKVNIIMLTVHEDNTSVYEALMAGATGYLLKSTPQSQIIDAIKDANDGGSPMNSNIANKVITLMRNSHSKSDDEELIKLSARETEILKKISNGIAYKNIADELFISIHTVRYHIRNIYDKIHVHTQSEAIAFAFRKGLI